MKRTFTCITALALACFLFCCSKPAEPTHPFSEEQNTVATVTDAEPVEPTADGTQETGPNESDAQASSAGSDDQQTPALLSSPADVELIPTDDYGQGYVFTYAGEEFVAYFDTYSWRVYDSYRINNHDDIVMICQALLDVHPVYGADWESLRTAEDMAYEWEQHNIVYALLPEDSPWRADVKDVDLDPDDQGKSFQEMYESRTGRPFDPRDYL